MSAKVAEPDGRLQAASFGWEVTDIHNNGADVYFQVTTPMFLATLDVDVATMLTGPSPIAGYEEVLCTAMISRGAEPTFSSPPSVFTELARSPQFSTHTTYNPNGLTVGVGPSYLGQDQFLTVILKSWVPLAGTASSTYRHVHTDPQAGIAAGDYLTFHMNHAGVQVDVEMQVVLGYRPLG